MALVESTGELVPRYATDRASLEQHCHLETYRAGGPGGQHRNTSDTAVRLHHPASGVTVTASERRSQQQNKALAYERMATRLKALNVVKKPRRSTKPTRGSVERRLQGKKQRSSVKAGRKAPRRDSD